MEKLSFKVAEFEGPLDLLLYLISKHKLDIRDIAIAELLEQYLEFIRSLEQADLEVASEFLEMASRLVYIKTVMLLPKHEEEGEQLKAELQGQLLEYQVCRQVALLLGEQGKLFQRYVRAPMKLEVDATYHHSHLPLELLNAYQDAVGRGRRRLPPPPQAFSGIVARRVVSVGSRIIFVLKKLYRSGQAAYDSLFSTSTDRSELVATFMAVLELVKAGRITVDDGEVRFCRDAARRHSGGENRDAGMPEESDFSKESEGVEREDGSFEEISFEEVSSEDGFTGAASFEDTSHKNASYEDVSHKDASFEDTPHKDIFFEDEPVYS